MTVEDLLAMIKDRADEQTKHTMMRNGGVEPLYGTKIGELKKLVRYVRKNQELALQLYATQVSEAMYLAGLCIDPKQMSKEQLEAWARQASWELHREATVANVAAESMFALPLARFWIAHEDPAFRTIGWSAYAAYISITADQLLDQQEIASYLQLIQRTIHQEENRVRYCMNQFVIVVGGYMKELTAKAKEIANSIGTITVDMGNTACKVPQAAQYIEKMEAMNRIGFKRKRAVC